MDIELTVLMPCLNEEETLATCINKALTCINKNGLRAEVLIADNGSTDNSIAIAESLGARVVRVKEKGYGNALYGGIVAAKGKYIIMGDSDDSYDFSQLMPFLGKLREGNDLVMGNRFRGGIAEGAMPFLHKYLGNPVLSFVGRLFFNIPVGDFHCGLRGFDRQKMLDAGLHTTGMEFASEMVVKSSLAGNKIKEVPTTLSKDGRNRKPHLNTWSDGWRHLRFLMLYSPKWLFFYPGIIFFIAGLALSIALIIAPIQINGIRFDVHTLLYSSLGILIGAQFIFFYALSKIYGGNNGLLPTDKTYHAINKIFTLERGLIWGGLALLAGIILTVYSVMNWSDTNFGDLSPSQSLRSVIPAVMLCVLGVQVIQNSFFISIINIKTNSRTN